MSKCRCGSQVYIDYPIHGGQSVRRDCAGCGRTRGFCKWLGGDDVRFDYGRPANAAEVAAAEQRHRVAAAFEASQTQRRKRAAAAKEARRREELEYGE